MRFSISAQRRENVAHRLGRFLEADAMLAQVLGSLSRVVADLEIVHDSEATSVSLIAASVAPARPPQPLERPDPVVVPVHPVRLQGVVADRGEAVELERLLAILGRGAGVHPAEQVGLAAAAGAGAGAAQLLERIV